MQRLRHHRTRRRPLRKLGLPALPIPAPRLLRRPDIGASKGVTHATNPARLLVLQMPARRELQSQLQPPPRQARIPRMRRTMTGARRVTPRSARRMARCLDALRAGERRGARPGAGHRRHSALLRVQLVPGPGAPEPKAAAREDPQRGGPAAGLAAREPASTGDAGPRLLRHRAPAATRPSERQAQSRR